MYSSKGFVRLDASMADDLSVVNSARVSFAKHSTELDDAGIGLIGFLMREKHGTPFEHNSFRFHIKCPVFVAREWFRHRIGSFNEFSARYSEVGDEFYLPEIENVRTQVGKPGSYYFEELEETETSAARAIMQTSMERSYSAYKALLKMDVAKELARTVLPVGMYTEFYWTVNARALMNFLSLRTAQTAQLEIRQYAKEVEQIFAEQMPVTCMWWRKYGKTAP
jgi:thymidylate synthase (FAD)